MDFEALFDDLLGIALHIGELDKEAVSKATSLLALPRYANAADSRGLLVRDIESVIDEIPPGPLPRSRTSGLTLDHQQHTRLFFSLDEPGTQLTHRRKVGGGVTRWQTPAVIYRVLLGLLELDDGPGRHAETSFELDAVRVIRIDRKSLSAVVVTEITYHITVNEQRLHALWLPDSDNVLLKAVDMERRPDVLAPQILQSGTRSLLTFGVGLRPGETLAITVEHQRRSDQHEAPWFPMRHAFQNLIVSFYTTQPVGELTIGIEKMPHDRHCATAWSADGLTMPLLHTARSLVSFGSLPPGVLATFGTEREFTFNGLHLDDSKNAKAFLEAIDHAKNQARGLPPA
jgi:hypothetical protein